MNQPQHPNPSLSSLLGMALLAMFVAVAASTVTYILLDRYAQPSVVIVEADQRTIVAQVSGEVATPGVYPLPDGARLGHLLDAAGGLTSDADLAVLNLAARIGDGESIEVPSKRTESPTPEADDTPDPVGPININTATQAELESLPGIGPVIGGRIVEYREEHGPFQSVEDLTAVEGISEDMLEEFRPLVTVDD
ncbi:MAG TPA: ComEA family DNA-binding protein [Thermomicrobiales bacterium]|nr:ComEA family DNA-binding protein [Thermomicrobiales bacterium]